MKKKEVERKLRSFGWSLERQGGNHEKWSNGIGIVNFVPRHPEINERLAKAILKLAEENPGKKGEV